MKNGRNILLFVCALSMMLVLGIFIGRNMSTDIAVLKENNNPVPATAAMDASDYLLDINTATKVQLMELPGIGEVIAERIIAYRTTNGDFRAISDLLNVDGIGETKLQQIKGFIRIGG